MSVYQINDYNNDCSDNDNTTDTNNNNNESFRDHVFGRPTEYKRRWIDFEIAEMVWRVSVYGIYLLINC